MASLNSYLKLMVGNNASDLHFSVGAQVGIKVEGMMKLVSGEPLPTGAVRELAYEILDEEQQAQFERDKEMNIGVSVKGIGRFRANMFFQRSEVAMVIRNLKTVIPSIEELNLPDIFTEFAQEPRGLVLVVGSTGSGKSSSLAAMIENRNQNQTGHILTIEDPIEFLFKHGKSIVNQREVGLDTNSYTDALKNALREDPDMVMIGEVRDAETMKHAISFADTGHLCLTTLHANNAIQALDRILNFFPENTHRQLCDDLALNLKAIISQRLVRGVDGKRLPAVEILPNTEFVANMLKKHDFAGIRESMEYSQDKGLISFEQSLVQLYKEGKISREVAIANADSRKSIQTKLDIADGVTTDDPYAV